MQKSVSLTWTPIPTGFGLTNGAFLYVGKSKGVQRRIRPIFIVQDALHDSPAG